MYKCRFCDVALIADDNWYASHKRKNDYICKSCHSARCKQSYKSNPHATKERSKRFRENNREVIKQINKDYRLRNLECIRKKDIIRAGKNKERNKIKKQQWYSKNRTVLLQKSKLARLANRDKIKSYHKNRRDTDLNYKLRTDISKYIGYCLSRRGSHKMENKAYLPFTILQLIQHLENLFEPWMNWKNRGRYNAKTWVDNDPSTWTWQIDHIIPQSTFNFESVDDEEFRKCWDLSNLRPLCAKQNVIDGVSKCRHKKSNS
jgi:hypothetical protein